MLQERQCVPYEARAPAAGTGRNATREAIAQRSISIVEEIETRTGPASRRSTPLAPPGVEHISGRRPPDPPGISPDFHQTSRSGISRITDPRRDGLCGWRVDRKRRLLG